jgi:ribokinase
VSRFDVCVVGSANLDLVAGTPRIPGPGETVLGESYTEHPGGKGLNQAVAAARSGARTAFIGALGHDAAADRLARVISSDAIDSTGVTRVDVPTGRALIAVDHEGENAIVVVPGANSRVTLSDPVDEAAVVLAQLEIPIEVVEEAFARAHRAGAATVLNPAPAAQLDPTLLGRCDVIVPNQHELARLGGVASLLAHGCGAVVTTLGAAGVEIVTVDGRTTVEPFAVDPIDTTGAGDAFCGALAARLAVGDGLSDAVRWAAAAGALATTTAGAVPAQPHADAIRALLNR